MRSWISADAGRRSVATSTIAAIVNAANASLQPGIGEADNVFGDGKIAKLLSNSMVPPWEPEPGPHIGQGLNHKAPLRPPRVRKIECVGAPAAQAVRSHLVFSAWSCEFPGTGRCLARVSLSAFFTFRYSGTYGTAGRLTSPILSIPAHAVRRRKAYPGLNHQFRSPVI